MAQPTRARLTLLNFAFVLSIITFIDRVCIATAMPFIRQDLGLDTVQVGYVFSAFTLAYAIFEIPTGWMGDVMGARRVLMRIVLWWSVFTALSGAAWNYASLLAARFLFGAGEAGAYPNISRSFANWMPVKERGRAHGVVFMGSRVGAALTPPIVYWIIVTFGWRVSFLVFAMLGVVWSVFWWRWYRDDPATHPSVNAEERVIIAEGTRDSVHRKVRFATLFTPSLLVVYLMYFCIIYGMYFYLTWLPTYFREARGFTPSQAQWLTSVVLAAGGVATMLGGWLTDMLTRRYGRKVGRSIGAVALPLSGLSMYTAAMVDSPMTAAAAMAFAAFFADMCLSPSWAICHDIAAEAAGTVTGAMNMMGNLGGTFSPLVVGYCLSWWPGVWSTPLEVTAGIYVLGGLITLLINPNRRAFGEPSGVRATV